MRANVAALCLSFLGAATVCSAQAPEAVNRTQPDFATAYCAGFVADPRIPDEMRLISGEQSSDKIVFEQGDYVFINRGQDKGVKVGDRYMVMRPEVDPYVVEWFKGQDKLMKAMGTHYLDLGQLKVVNVQPKVAVAQVTFSCDTMQRGDIVRPFEERPIPPYKEAGAFDHFAPVSGKSVGTIVATRDYGQAPMAGTPVYVNLGSSQGVKVGDYLRFFRYQGTMQEYPPQTKDYQYLIFGFGSTPVRYQWNDLPREVVGEGIVLSVSKNSSTVLITISQKAVHTGYNAEIE
jgi:hypothetical protein